MEIPTLTVQPRKPEGSRAAARLRRAGRLPAIVYGHGQDPVPVSLDYHDVELQLKHGMHVVKLDMSGDVQPCQFKDAQYDHLGSAIVHVDLVRVDLTERVKVAVQIEFRGTPKGVAEGGQLRHELTEMEIECVVSDIPETIRADISDLGLDEVLYLKDITLPDNMTAVGDPDTVVAVVRRAAVAETAEEGETPAPGEPEVITKGKAEEDKSEENG
ncbi:MAG: 50S ribosomal protein L25 [Phycisphaerae bacterium]